MDVDQIARQVQRYLEHYAALAMQGAIPDTPQGRKEKGGYRSPASEALDNFIWENWVAASYIDWRVAALRRSGSAWRGVRFAAVLDRLDNDPACISTWENQATDADRADYAAWLKLCRMVADSMHAEHPDIEISVVLNPKPQGETDEEDDPEPLKGNVADHKRNQRYSTEHKYRGYYETLERIEAENAKYGMTRRGAVHLCALEEGVGTRTIWKSIELVEGPKQSAV